MITSELPFLFPLKKITDVQKLQANTLRKSNMACWKMDHRNQWFSQLESSNHSSGIFHVADFPTISGVFPMIFRISFLLQHSRDWRMVPKQAQRLRIAFGQAPKRLDFWNLKRRAQKGINRPAVEPGNHSIDIIWYLCAEWCSSGL